MIGRIAWNFRSRPCLAEPPALSPSTMKISQNFGSRSWQSASFPGRSAVSSAPLRRVRSRALRAASRARAASIAFVRIRFGDRRVLLEERPQVFVDGRLDDPLDFAVAQLGLGLALELRVPQLDADDRDQPLAHILAGRIFAQVFEQVVRLRVGVDGPRQRRLESDQVRAALVRVDVVGEGEDGFAVAVVVLHGGFDDDVLLARLKVDRFRVKHGLVRVQVLDERGDPAFVLEDVAPVGAQVLEDDLQPLVEEGQFAQPGGDGVVAELERLEDLVVRLEGDLGSPPLGRPGLPELRHRLAPFVALLEDLASRARSRGPAAGSAR